MNNVFNLANSMTPLTQYFIVVKLTLDHTTRISNQVSSCDLVPQ